MITLLLIFFPLVAALMLLLVKGEQVKKIALGAAIVEFAISMFAVFQFQKNADTQFELNYAWIKSMGINFHVGMDGISLLLVILTTFLVPIIILTSFNKQYKNPSAFYSLILAMQFALIGVFVSLDGFLFYIFWELALIPIYFICLLWGGDDRARITFKFFVYTLAGSLLMLAGLIYLYQFTPNHTFDIKALYAAGQSLDVVHQGYVFWAMFMAFAIKMPVFPFHTWQPDTYTTAPTQGTMLLSGIMLKMGTYGVIRWLLPIAPLGVEHYAHLAITLAVIGILYASTIAIVQKDFKRLIAYSSIAHVGLIAAGILAGNVQGVQGSMIQMLSHGVNVVGLFFIVDLIQTRTNTRDLHSLGGIRNVNPQFAVLFLIVLLGSVALPLTNGFIGEFLLLNGVYQYSAWMAAFAGISVILGAVYMLRSYQSIMLGETNALTSSFAPLTGNEKAVLVIICAAIIAFGVFPKPLLDIVEPSVIKLVDGFNLAIGK
ncbi:MAG: NADH-quinone oxidoreductase subunit M [Bacteroidetes bacterium]|nr:NADH-quinone oxidoreductase subunit M [Bacteroidota bacterium]